jgi:hypothetical protein
LALSLVFGCSGHSPRPQPETGVASGTGSAATDRIPMAGDCYSAPGATGGLADPATQLVPCTGPHLWETVFVGSFTASQPDSPARTAQAWLQCQQPADALLGGDWRGGYLNLTVTLPTRDEQRHGLTWYRCDLARTDENLAMARTGTGPLRDALRGAGPDAITCVGGPQDNAAARLVRRASCATPHQAEFVGVLPAHDGSAPAKLGSADADRACAGLVARYLGYPAGEPSRSRYVGSTVLGSSSYGQPGAFDYRCYAIAASGGELTGSVKGIRAGRPGA